MLTSEEIIDAIKQLPKREQTKLLKELFLDSYKEEDIIDELHVFFDEGDKAK